MCCGRSVRLLCPLPVFEMGIGRLSVCAIALGIVFAVSAAAQEKPDKVDLCEFCHGDDGSGAGYAYVPIIAGTPAAHLEEALYAYKDGARNCVGVPVMCDTVEFLSDEDIVELAEYYAAMPRISSNEAFDEQLAAVGKIIHEEHCAQCHVSPDDENVAEALGIPLDGQRSAYLRLALGAYLTGDRQTLVPVMADKLKLLDPDKIQALVHYYASYAP